MTRTFGENFKSAVQKQEQFESQREGLRAHGTFLFGLDVLNVP